MKRKLKWGEEHLENPGAPAPGTELLATCKYLRQRLAEEVKARKKWEKIAKACGATGEFEKEPRA